MWVRHKARPYSGKFGTLGIKNPRFKTRAQAGIARSSSGRYKRVLRKSLLLGEPSSMGSGPESWRTFGVVALLATLVIFFNLGGTRLWDRDEPRNAGCAWEMLQRGDWVVPTFNGQLRGHKPVLLYWLIMSAYTVFGRTEWAARFWSAAVSVGTCLLLADMVRCWLGWKTAVCAGLVLATSLMFVVAARVATPDALLIFFVTAALWCFTCFYVACEPLGCDGHYTSLTQNYRKRWSHFFCLAFYGLLGLAGLSKGLVGILLPLAIVGTFLWIENLRGYNRTNCTRSARFVGSFFCAVKSMRPILGCIIILLVTSPWYVWVTHRTDGAFLYEFFFIHHWQRARSPMEGHSGPLYYYVPAMLVGLFPWSIFFIPTILQVWRMRREEAHKRFIVFFLCWILVWVGAFSLAQTKLPSYITPVYPACAALVALYLSQWEEKRARCAEFWMPAALAVLAVVGGLLAVAITLVAPRYFPSEHWLGVVGLIPLITAVVSGWGWIRLGRRVVIPTLVAGAMLWCLGLFGWAASRVDRHRQFEQMLTELNKQHTNAQWATLDVLEPSWVYYLGSPIQVFHSNTGSNATVRIIEFLQSDTEHRLVATATRYRELQPHLSPDVRMVAEVPYFLKDERLVILRSIPRSAQTTASLEYPPR